MANNGLVVRACHSLRASADGQMVAELALHRLRTMNRAEEVQLFRKSRDISILSSSGSGKVRVTSSPLVRQCSAGSADQVLLNVLKTPLRKVQLLATSNQETSCCPDDVDGKVNITFFKGVCTVLLEKRKKKSVPGRTGWAQNLWKFWICSSKSVPLRTQT